MAATLAALLLIGAAGWLWMASLAARELAIGYGRALCREAGVQLLDQTVALQRFRVRRSCGGFEFCRRYRFDVSLDGFDRHAGYLDLRGSRLEAFALPSAGTVLAQPVT